MKIQDAVRERTKDLITEGVGNCFRQPRVERERNANSFEASIAYTAFSVGLPIAVDMLTAGADCAFKAMGEQPEPDKWADGLISVAYRLANNDRDLPATRAILAALREASMPGDEVKRAIAEIERMLPAPMAQASDEKEA